MESLPLNTSWINGLNNFFANFSESTRYQFLYSEKLLLAYNLFLCFTIAFGVVGNLLVLIVFGKLKVSSSTDWFIIFITVFDFISSFANVPIYLTFTNGVWKYYGSDVLCKMHMYLSQVVVMTSVILTGGLAVERYLLICRLHSAMMSKTKARNTCLVISLVAVIISIPTVLMHKNQRNRCEAGVMGILPFLYFVAVFLVFIAVFVLVVVCYCKIYLAIASSEQNFNEHHQRKFRSIVNVLPLSKLSKIHPISSTTTSSHSPKHINVADNNTVSVIHADKPSCGHINGQGIQNPAHRSSKTRTPDGSTRSVDQNSSRLNSFTADNCRSRHFKQKVRITQIAFLICSIFIISWVIPLTCFILLQTLERTPRLLRFALFGKMAYLLNTFTNPIIYVWLNKKFRMKLKECFRWKF